MSMMVSFVLSFFLRDVLDEILNLIESVSEGFPTYSQFLAKQFSTLNIAHLSKFVVNFNLIILSKPKYIVILAGLFL